MKDCNGVEIQVGDVVEFGRQTTGTVSEVGENYYVCNDWPSGVENGIKFYLSSYVEVISKSKQKETIMTPAQEAGLVIGKNYRYTNGTSNAVFNNNEIVTSIRDDGSDAPQFKSVKSSVTAYAFVNNIKPSEEKETNMQTQEVTTNTKHEYADILIAIANGEQIECRAAEDQWCTYEDNDTVLYSIYHRNFADVIRVKPRTISINGHEVPEPVKVKPEIGDFYYAVSFTDLDNFFLSTFHDSYTDDLLFNKGIMHLTAEAVQKHAEALLSFTKV